MTHDTLRNSVLSVVGRTLFLSVDQILYGKLQILHLAQQPECQMRQSERADEERNCPQDNTVLWGICYQNSQPQQGDDCAEKSQHQTGHIDQAHTTPDGQGEKQNHRRGHNFQHQPQKSPYHSHGTVTPSFVLFSL